MVSEYIIVILHTIINLIPIHSALKKLSKMQLITKVKMINGKILIFFKKNFRVYNLHTSIKIKLKVIKNKINLLLGKKNILVAYKINNKNLITFFILNSFQASH